MTAVLSSIRQYPGRGYAGSLVGGGHEIDTVLNGRTNVAAIRTLVITAVDSTLYTVDANGVRISFTSGVGTTVALIRAGLAAAALASAFFNALATLVASGADLVATERLPAVGPVTFAFGANLAVTVNTAHSNEQYIPAGIIIQLDSTQTIAGAPLPGKMADAAGDQVLGISSFEQQYVDPTRTDLAVYPPYRAMSVVRKGPILVPVETNVGPTDVPCFRVTASGANTQLGALRAGTDSGTAVALTGIARFKEVALAGALAELSINVP